MVCFRRPRHTKGQLNESYGYKNGNEAIELVRNGSPPPHLEEEGPDAEKKPLVKNKNNKKKNAKKKLIDDQDNKDTQCRKVSCHDKVTQTEDVEHQGLSRDTSILPNNSSDIADFPKAVTNNNLPVVDSTKTGDTDTNSSSTTTPTLESAKNEKTEVTETVPRKKVSQGWAALKRASLVPSVHTDPTSIIKDDGTISFDVCSRLLQRPSVKNYTTLNICLKKCTSKFYGEILYNCNALQTMFDTLAALSLKGSRSLSDTVLQSEIVKAIKILINSEIGMNYLLGDECSLVTDMALGKR